MAKISLRSYCQEIENLIDHSVIDQAIAHCKHILRFFPKHLETFRLLGKAYIEEQRYTEAADILQRVLSVIPDDFVSRLGISIIREDEGNLDAAIYNMERAYEIQPTNSAIQDELKRLYGRRDGIEPAKIRLTRGALVRMYIRGELYPQAIAEIIAVLAEDPDRMDLEILLANIYFKTNRKVEATEICSRIVAKLPYCYEANRLLSEILPGTSRAQDGLIYQRRLYELDPYLMYMDPSSPTVAEVPDNAVMLEYLDVSTIPVITEESPSWATSAGIQWEETREEESITHPDWLTEQTPEYPPDLPIEEPSPFPDTFHTFPEEIIEGADKSFEDKEKITDSPLPDWFESAGWAISEGDATALPESQLPPSIEENIPLEEAEIPDWLQDMAPTEEPQIPGRESVVDRTGWLNEILIAEQGEPPTEPLEPTPDQISQYKDIPGISPLEPEIEEFPMPDLETISDESEVSLPDQESVPDWLTSIESQIEEPVMSPKEDLPDWLQGLGEESIQPHDQPAFPSAEFPSWLPESESITNETGVEPGLEKADDELTVFQTPETTPDDTGEEMIEQRMAEEWLPDIEAITPNELPSIEEEGQESSAEITEVEQPMAEISSQEIFETPIDQQNEIPPLEAEEETFAWLESLAVQQGADSDELLAQPADKEISLPEWLQEPDELVPENLPVIDKEEGTIEEAVEIQEVQEILPAVDILEFNGETPETPPELSIPEPPIVQEDTKPTIRREPAIPESPSKSPSEESSKEDIIPVSEEQLPDFQLDRSLEQASEISDLEIESELPETSFSEDDSAFSWLESLAAKQGADEAEMLTHIDERSETPPTWVQAEDESKSSISSPDKSQLEGISEQSILSEQELTPTELEPEEPAINQAEVIPTPDKPPIDNIPAWLTEITPPEKTIGDVEQPEGEIQEWLEGLDETQSIEPDREEGEIITSWLAEETEDEIPSSESELMDISPEVIGEERLPGLDEAQAILKEGQEALWAGDLETALNLFDQLIRSGFLMEEVIHDLRDATYRYPVDIGIWQSLGDAYSKNNMLQEALDAYSKAEDLIR